LSVGCLTNLSNFTLPRLNAADYAWFVFDAAVWFAAAATLQAFAAATLPTYLRLPSSDAVFAVQRLPATFVMGVILSGS
jgi:hypothetical protein